MAEPNCTTNVVSIRGGKCRRRKNRPEDGKTIQFRRMLSTCERDAFETQDAISLALSWGMAGKLPCNNLRLIAGTLDARKDFQLRLAEVEIARAEKDAFSAKVDRVRLLHGIEAAKEMYPENDRLFERYRQAIADVAATPVHTRLDLECKKRAIGSIWLKAEGQWYDQLRARVAEDEARLRFKRSSLSSCVN